MWVQIYCSSKQRQSFQPFNMIWWSLFLCTPPNVFHVVFKTVNDDVESVLLKYQWCSEKNESNRNICFMNNGIWEEPDLIIRVLFNHLIIVQTVPPAREEQVVWTSLALFLYLRSSCLRCAKCVCVCVYMLISCLSAHQQRRVNTSFYQLVSHAHTPGLWEAHLLHGLKVKTEKRTPLSWYFTCKTWW